ncbi:hypothetical protein HOLleu_14715 [Holothuria leucospilota]|uniref:Uncharacterized protein n=1 Tax=Holothuria leucospilota TaxID=206669 RepID=A0A9Q1C9C4_HOLLE|nr:hypothetical protein HOLleu_14715 [Holothuria leucospilota]
MFDIRELPDNQGVYEPLEGKIKRVIEQIQSKEVQTSRKILPAKLKVKVEWKFYVDKTSGLIKSGDFTGVEHHKIQSTIQLENIIPGHPKLSIIKDLWTQFSCIMTLLRGKGDFTTCQIEVLQKKCKDWVKLFTTVYLAKDVTPYMHVLVYHVPESLRIHGNINVYSQQSVEKLNDTVTCWFFRSSNHQNNSALKQVLCKQNRTDYLNTNCQRDRKFSVSCSACLGEGHNKRTCLKPKNV